MGTINLGRVKPVFRGAYSGATAYVVDDIVTYSNETYICILASTGNLPTDTTYWTKLAAKGVDGTDVSTTLTTQGDLLYRDGSGLQRLAAGTSGQVLQTGGAGANPSWGTVSSDYVKLAETNISTAVSNVAFQSVFTSDYDTYKIFVSGLSSAANNRIHIRYMNGSSTISQGDYYYVVDGSWHNSSNSTGAYSNGARAQSQYEPFNWNTPVNNSDATSFECTVFNPLNTTHYKNISTTFSAVEGAFTYQTTGTSFGTLAVSATAYDGINFIASTSTFDQGKFQVYGIK